MKEALLNFLTEPEEHKDPTNNFKNIFDESADKLSESESGGKKSFEHIQIKIILMINVDNKEVSYQI